MSKIAFFDSGVGGLTVLCEAQKLLPHEEYLYYADTDNVPYGNKSKELVRSAVLRAVEFIAGQGVDALVVACNTATSVAVNELRSIYSFPVIGMEPAVKPAVVSRQHKKVLVVATEMTLKEEKFRNLVASLDSGDVVDYVPFQKLVRFAEEFKFNEPEVKAYLKEQLGLIEINDYESIVLGCTHFPYFRNHIAGLIPANISILDGNLGTVRHLARQITITQDPISKPVSYFESGRLTVPDRYDRYLQYYLNQQKSAR